MKTPIEDKIETAIVEGKKALFFLAESPQGLCDNTQTNMNS